MRLTGITGGIGSGKSVVSRILRCKGFKVYDCDLEARRLMDSSELIRTELKRHWGESVYDANGVMDRRLVAGHVFGDPDEKRWLDALVHGRVAEDLRQWTERNAGDEELFVESAILCGSGLSAMCARIWNVTAPLEVRLRRLEMRSGMNAGEAMSRIASQETEAGMLCDATVSVFEIVNENSASLLRQIDELIKK